MPTWLNRILSWTGLRDAWSPGPTPNPWAVPSDPAATEPSLADPAASDPYHDGQWSPLIAPVLTDPAADQVRADAYVPPYTGPLDLDDYGRETDEMRRAYRDLHRTEPALRSAIDGKAAAVAALDVSVLPEDKDHPDDCRAAKFVDWTVSRSPHGWDGLILAILRPALIDGFSLAEKVLKGIDDSREWHGFWGLRHVKARDTAHLQLRLDGYRNVLGVVNTVRGLRTYSPAKFIRFTHAELFDNPFGQSDLRAAYRAAGQIQDAYRLWYLALKRCGEPYLHGKYDHPAHRAEFEKALRALRAGGWAVTGPNDEIAVLDLAGAASFDAFERKVRILREDIFLAVRGAYTPFIQANSGAGETRGDTAVSQRGGSDPVEEVLARAVGRVLTEQLVPDLVRPNFGDRVGLPRVVLGGVNWGELRTRLDILERAKKLGLSVSARWAHETLQIPPAATPDDELGGRKPGPKSGAGGDEPHSPAGLRTFSVSESPGHPPHGRSDLIRKEITDKNGKQTHVWVNPETGDESPGGLLRDDLRQAQHKLVADATGGRGTDPAKSRPTNVLIGRAQVYEWARRFKDAGVDASFVKTNRPGMVRLVLPHSAGDPAVRKKVEDLLRQTGIGARPGAAGELDEATNALFGKESDEHERVLAFDPAGKEAYVLGRPIGPFQAPPALPAIPAESDSGSGGPTKPAGTPADAVKNEAVLKEIISRLKTGDGVRVEDVAGTKVVFVTMSDGSVLRVARQMVPNPAFVGPVVDARKKLGLDPLTGGDTDPIRGGIYPGFPDAVAQARQVENALLAGGAPRTVAIPSAVQAQYPPGTDPGRQAEILRLQVPNRPLSLRLVESIPVVPKLEEGMRLYDRDPKAAMEKFREARNEALLEGAILVGPGLILKGGKYVWAAARGTRAAEAVAAADAVAGTERALATEAEALLAERTASSSPLTRHAGGARPARDVARSEGYRPWWNETPPEVVSASVVDDLPRASLSELFGRDLTAVANRPGVAGVTVTDSMINNGHLWRLTQESGGLEYMLTREIFNVEGRGIVRVYRLYSGEPGRVRVPRLTDSRYVEEIAHTHPQTGGIVDRFPSDTVNHAGQRVGDIPALEYQYELMLQRNPNAPVPRGRIVFGPGENDSTTYFPQFPGTGGK